jgi:hypothetical protein
MRKLLIAKSSQDMQSLFEPVTSEIIGLVSQQVWEVKEKKGAVINVRITSLPKWRETHRAEKNDEYFDFKHLKLCAHIDISNFFV